MSRTRPSSRAASGPRAGASSRPGVRPAGGRRGASRTRVQTGPVRRSGASPQRPRFTGRAAILVLVVAVLGVSYASSMRAYLEQRAHVAALNDNIAGSLAHIEALEREKARWDDPAYIRTQARLRFGWVAPGEIGLQVILDEDGTPLDHDDSLAASVDTAAGVDDEPLWWQSAWRSVEIAGDPERFEKPPPAARIRAPRSARD